MAEPFIAWDSAGAPAASAWRAAGPHTAEAGFQDPTLGWVGVRAQTVASAVHATVIASSAEAGQSLAAHVSGLG
ncbi:MAG TPA: hypothetical protein VM711_07880, partial [Sphingomicrobium sp.]|nr:hypothetical protein [Sphingomicrobium sp.]